RGVDNIPTPVDMIPVSPTPGKTIPGKSWPDLGGEIAPAITTPVVITGVDIVAEQRTPANCITTPVDTTGVLPTADTTAPDEPASRQAQDSVSQIPPRLRQHPITTPVQPPPALTAPVGVEPPATTPTPPKTPPRITAPVNIEPPAARSTPVRTTPDITTSVVSQARPYNVHRAVLAQDGHSHTEQLLYDILWRSAKSANQGDAYRLVQIPQSELAAAVRMTTKNLRIALDRLVDKLAIEELRTFDRGTRVARTWKVYSYKSILERRKAAGMEWVIRDRGVRFIDPGSIP